MRFPVVLFDLDGTVIDSGAIILASMRHAAETVVGGECTDDELLKAVGGPGLEAQMVALDPNRVDELVRVYRAHNEPLHDTLEFCAGMDVVLAELKRAATGSASSRPSGASPSSSRSRGCRSSISSRPSSAATRPSGTSPTRSRCCSRSSGSARAPREAAYVGDSPFDMQAAKAAGLYAIGVSWGRIHTADKLADADVVVDRPEELLELV